jgi:Transposase DNA-binding/Transposase Tn5 dimerisation domain
LEALGIGHGTSKEQERSMQDYRLEEGAVTEFGQAPLGDARRTERLVHLASVLGAQPTASLPDATGDPATLKAAYRFFDNDAIDPAQILTSHVKATTARLRQVPRVLAVQDSTLLDWTPHPNTTGLGPLATLHQQGLLVHSTLAITPERVPLGLLAQEVWARDAATFAHKGAPKQRPIDEKESQKWLTSLAAVVQLHEDCPETHIVSVGDAEADVYDRFVAPRSSGVDLLVRAGQNRRVAHEQKMLWAAVERAPMVATREVRVPRRDGHPARTAVLSVPWQAVTLRPPKHRASEQLADVALWAVLAVEAKPPAGVETVEWLLLTTVPIETTADALERLDWYECRWGIEVWHKVLKSGCKIEARQLERAERLKRCLALYSVIAWRILYGTMLARAAPEAPCTVLLEDDEWQALSCAIHRTAQPPTDVPTIRTAVRWIGQLGGFLGRKGDGEPGVTVLWRGFQHLLDLTTMYRIMRPPSLHRNVGND